MAIQLSTAITDALLSLSCLYGVMRLALLCPTAAIGMLLMAIASTIGAWRFIHTFPTKSIVTAHQYMSRISSVVSMAYFAAGFFHLAKYPLFNSIYLLVGVGFMFSELFTNNSSRTQTVFVLNLLAIVPSLLLHIIKFNMAGITAIILYIVAGSVVKTNGNMFGFIPRVDIFHVMLAIGNLYMITAFSNIKISNRAA